MKIDAKEGFFIKSFEKTDFIGVIFLFPPCFKNNTILSIDDKVIIEKPGDILHLGSR